MDKMLLLFAAVVLAAAFPAHAGVLQDGKWSASGCGGMPETPVVDSSSAAAFNQSIGKINTWQNGIKAYHDCMVKEANADSAAINSTATGEQTRINKAMEEVNAAAAAGKQKLEKQPSSPSPSFNSPMMPPSSMPGGAGY